VSGTILIYGATGYTGKLIAKAASDAGASGRATTCRPRSAGTAKVRPSRRFSGTPMNACLGRIAALGRTAGAGGKAGVQIRSRKRRDQSGPCANASGPLLYRGERASCSGRKKKL